MIKHYLKVAIRNLLKYKTQSLISIIGLAIGFACFALSALWIRYEMTYDDFHEGAERIYLAGNQFDMQGDGFSYYSSDLLADHLMQHFPEIEKACHVRYFKEKRNYKYNEQECPLTQIYADSNFVSMFGIKVIDGDTHLRLNENQVAITDKAAERIFGDESPIGKQLTISDRPGVHKTIIAVVESWKGHSQYTYDILLPYLEYNASWFRQSLHTLFRIHPHANVEALRQKMSKMEVHIEENGSKATISAPIALLKTLRSTHPEEDMNVKLNHVRLFAYIGGLVILCGLCNYLTMLVTRIRMRKRELALRKVNGASDGGSIFLLLSELILLLLISTGVGLMLIELILPTFKRLSQIDEHTTFFYKEALIYVFGLIVVTTGIAALLVRYVSKRALQDSIGSKANLHFSGWFYKGSILFQLLISIGFVFCTAVMMKQLNFLLNSRELGIQRHNVGVILYAYQFEGVPFNDILEKMPEVTQTLNKYDTPIPKSSFMSVVVDRWDDQPDGSQQINLSQEIIGPDFANFFEVTVLEGSIPGEKDEPGMIVINEAMLKAMGWNQPIGKKIYFGNESYTVKGVIKDIYYNAPIHPVKPAFYYSIYDAEKEGKVGGTPIFKFKEGTWNSVCQKLQEVARKANPDSELGLCNIEEKYDSFMKSEDTLSKLLSTVSAICIVIAVFGIFSLVTLSCEQRCKEIAIRKVNGASIGNILNLFFKEYLLLLIGASAVAFPLGYLIMKHWLENYMKQTPIGFFIYLSIFVGMGLVILLSIVWRVWKTARMNPAEVIKHE